MLKPGFDAQPTLKGALLELTPLTAEDFEGLAKAASDPKIWAMHPAKTRHERAVFIPYFGWLLTSNSALVIKDKQGQICGCSRYYTAPDMPDTVSIGFTFLTREHWGGPANAQIKSLMLNHAFRSEPEVWLHIDPANLRSQKATEKLGATHIYTADLDLGTGLAPFMCYKIDAPALLLA